MWKYVTSVGWQIQCCLSVLPKLISKFKCNFNHYPNWIFFFLRKTDKLYVKLLWERKAADIKSNQSWKCCRICSTWIQDTLKLQWQKQWGTGEKTNTHINNIKWISQIHRYVAYWFWQRHWSNSTCRQRFLGTHNPAQSIKGKIDKLDFIKIKTALQKTSLRKQKCKSQTRRK